MVSRKILIFTLLVCFALASPCMAKQGRPGVDDAVRALVEQHGKALSAHDLKGIMDTYAPVEGIILVGTGPGETYVGEESVGGAYNQFFNRFEANTLSFKYDWVYTGSRGDAAWFAVTIGAEGTVNGEKKERMFNMTGTLLKIKGKWRFVSNHFSRLGAEQQVPEKTK